MQDTVVSTKYWHREADGRLQCDLCPRHCRLRDGQRGLCYVRQRLDDEIKLVTYGRSSGFCIDPIEKKPFFHALPGSTALSFGMLGCDYHCAYCQNHFTSQAMRDPASDMAAGVVRKISAEQIIAPNARQNHSGLSSVSTASVMARKISAAPT